ncbi:MAG TPA: DUF3662 and FHA domain-containing protein [Propionibacteriaceae bacterium]|nr:DUF3662 and FHA domain-containing protein [Propionibacteriaceae bacterium]
MGLFDKLEKKIEGAVNGVFARTFKGDVQPVEIAARLQRELDSEAKLLSREKRLVPNDFTIGLSVHDFERLYPYSRTLNAEITAELREHAAERQYVFNGPISITYERDEALPTGRFTVASAAVAGVVTATAVSETAIRRSPLVLEVNGVRHPLVPPGLVIGRGSEADLRINDPGISRRHAQIIVVGAGDALTARIEDLGSTNGITVNGRKVTSAALDEGTKIEIGSTRMLVHSPAGV